MSRLNFITKEGVQAASSRLEHTRFLVRIGMWQGYSVGSASALIPAFFLTSLEAWTWLGVSAAAGAVVVALLNRIILTK